MFLTEFINTQETPGCNMTQEGRTCPEHGMMECPGYKMIEGFKEPKMSAQERLYKRHQALRKKSGLPDPNYYKELGKSYDIENDQERYARQAEIRKKYGINESLRDGEYYTWTVHFDDGTSQKINVGSDEFDAKSYFAKKGKNVVKVDRNWAVHGGDYIPTSRDRQGDEQERRDREARAFRQYDRRMTETAGHKQKVSMTDYNQWRDQVDAQGGEIHTQKDRNHLVAQSWDGDIIGEFNLKSNQGYIGKEGVAEETGELNEADSYAEVGLTGSRFHAQVARIMQDLVQEYQDEVRAGTTSPSAPDTTKFRAHRGGMIEYANNQTVHGDYYSGNRTYIDFIKIGGGLDPKVRQDLFRDFHADMMEVFGIDVKPGLHVKTTDGYTFFFPSPETGTNWGGFGFLHPGQPKKQDVEETSDYFRRRQREEEIISGKRPARKRAPAQTSDYAKRREQQKKQGVAEADQAGQGFALGKVLPFPSLLKEISNKLAAGTNTQWKMSKQGDSTFLFRGQNDFGVSSMLVVETEGDGWVTAGHGIVTPDGEVEIFREITQHLPMTLVSAHEIADQAAQTYFDIDLSDYADEEDLDEAGPFSYGAKPPRKGTVAYYAMMKRKEQEKGKQPIEPKDNMVGNAKILPKDVKEGVTSPEIKQAYADIMKTKPHTPERKAAVKKYQALRAQALDKKKQGVKEAKHFRTAYGWAGGRNEKTGKTYKHPEQIKADREKKQGISKDAETKFHAKLDTLVHDTFGKRKGEMEEGLRDPKDNPCWKGYHPVGTKKKNGRTVPNCVPTNEDIEKYVEELERAGYQILK